MSRRKPDDSLTCAYPKCRKPITGADLAKRACTAAGPMHEQCYRTHWMEVEDLTKRAIAEGRHSVVPMLPLGPTRKEFGR
jgi:hypothetical protein